MPATGWKRPLTPEKLGAKDAEPDVAVGGLVPVSDFSCSYQPNDKSPIWTCGGAIDLGNVFGGEKQSGSGSESPAGGGEKGDSGGEKCAPESFFPPRAAGRIQINPLALASLGFSVSNASFEIDPPDPLAVITGFGANFVFDPDLEMGGHLDLAVGPCVDDERPFDAQGELAAKLSSTGFFLDVDGHLDLNLVKFSTELAHAHFEYASEDNSTKLSFYVTAGLRVDGFGVTGMIDGALATNPFLWQAGLSGQISAFGASFSGQGVISNAGFGGCGTVHIGFWNGSVGSSTSSAPVRPTGTDAISPASTRSPTRVRAPSARLRSCGSRADRIVSRSPRPAPTAFRTSSS